jgi:hypothetical protein
MNWFTRFFMNTDPLGGKCPCPACQGIHNGPHQPDCDRSQQRAQVPPLPMPPHPPPARQPMDINTVRAAREEAERQINEVLIDLQQKTGVSAMWLHAEFPPAPQRQTEGLVPIVQIRIASPW